MPYHKCLRGIHKKSYSTIQLHFILKSLPISYGNKGRFSLFSHLTNQLKSMYEGFFAIISVVGKECPSSMNTRDSQSSLSLKFFS